MYYCFLKVYKYKPLPCYRRKYRKKELRILLPLKINFTFYTVQYITLLKSEFSLTLKVTVTSATDNKFCDIFLDK